MDLHLCRLCYENSGVTSLFDVSDAGIEFSAEVNYCTKVIIHKGDGLPANICVCCEEELAAAYRFALKCEKTEQQLRSLQFPLKQECDTKDFIKIEDIINSAPDNSLEEPYDSPHFEDIKQELPEIRTKRKYVKRKSLKRESKKIGPSQCKVCGRLCNSRSILSIHMRCHTNEKPHACPSCDKRYKDGGTLKRHIERNHSIGRTKSIICEHCGKAFYSKTDCKIHMRVHTGETPYACMKCPARFTQIGSLQRHTLTHTGERSHMCSKCSKTFPTRGQLQRHYPVHSDEKHFKCPLCDILFKYDYNLKKHIKMHANSMNKAFICDYCNRSFCYKVNLQMHIRRLHSSKSGYCSQCAKYFSNFEMHMLKHAGVRPMKCELCPASFFDLRGLAKHVNFQHKFVDKHKCTIDGCNLSFPSQPMLDYHVTRYHKSIKPFACEKCPRCFYRKSDMVRHVKGSHKVFKVE